MPSCPLYWPTSAAGALAGAGVPPSIASYSGVGRAEGRDGSGEVQALTSHPSASPPALAPSLPYSTAPLFPHPASTIPYNLLPASPCHSQTQLPALPRYPQAGCPAWCQAAGTLGTWVTTLAAQPALGAQAARGSLLGVKRRRAARGRCRLLLLRDEERDSRGLSSVWRREGDREEGEMEEFV